MKPLKMKKDSWLSPRRVIGHGTTGNIILCKRTDRFTLGKQQKVINRGYVACKLIRKTNVPGSVDPSKIAAKEKDVLCRVNNPFIAKLRFAYECSAGFLLGLEHYQGGDLFTRVVEGPMDDNEVRGVIAEVFLGLNALHQMNIIYHDLKPENVAISKDGHIRLIDFGISTILEKKGDKCACRGGSLPYVSPDLLQGELHGIETDYWALGVLLFELLVGYAPFESENNVECMHRVCKEELTIPDTVNSAARHLTKGLLRKDCKRRFNKTQVENHPFLHSLCWDEVKQELHPPFPVSEDPFAYAEEFRYDNPCAELDEWICCNITDSRQDNCSDTESKDEICLSTYAPFKLQPCNLGLGLEKSYLLVNE